LAVVEKTNFPSTKIFFFPEKRLCSNSTFNSVASKKKVQAWRNFEDFMCRPMWSTWYCGDRILPQLDGVTTGSVAFSAHSKSSASLVMDLTEHGVGIEIKLPHSQTSPGVSRNSGETLATTGNSFRPFRVTRAK